MYFRILLISLIGTLAPVGTASILNAKPLNIITDIAPIAAIAKGVTGSAQTTNSLIPSNVDVHDFALKPSDIRKLQQADLILWLGPIASPGLAKLLSQPAFAGKALTLENPHPLTMRPTGVLPGPGSNNVDPHVWLNPEAARLWAGQIAQKLQQLDPENSEIYTDNHQDFLGGLDQTLADINASLVAVQPLPFIQFHDAFQYFEAYFGLTVLGTATSAAEEQASLATITALRAALVNHPVTCVFAEPHPASNRARVLLETAGARPGFLDALGRDIALQDYTYPALLRSIAKGFTDCFERVDK